MNDDIRWWMLELQRDEDGILYLPVGITPLSAASLQNACYHEERAVLLGNRGDAAQWAYEMNAEMDF
jgi:hypothetical protein